LLPINQNQALFALLGTTYGGNGQTTFALPNLRGRVPVHFAASPMLGETGGAEMVTLTEEQLPAHGHLRGSSRQATATSPVGHVLSHAARRGPLAFAAPANRVVMPGTQSKGQGQAHTNMQPFLTLYFAIALQGIFPARI
jgi:microcystin-dependent protein